MSFERTFKTIYWTLLQIVYTVSCLANWNSIGHHFVFVEFGLPFYFRHGRSILFSPAISEIWPSFGHWQAAISSPEIWPQDVSFGDILTVLNLQCKIFSHCHYLLSTWAVGYCLFWTNHNTISLYNYSWLISILQEKRYNIAGPLCFSGDVLKYDAILPEVCF